MWRLKLQNLEDRQFDELWQDLSILWSGSIGTSTSHFHNMHAAFAFAAADRPLLIDKLIAESDGFGIEPATQQVGVDVLNAIAFLPGAPTPSAIKSWPPRSQCGCDWAAAGHSANC